MAKETRKANTPSSAERIGNDRIAEKLLDPNLGLKDLIEDTFGVTLSHERKMTTSSGPRENGKPGEKKSTITNYIHITGKTAEVRRSAATVIRQCGRRIEELEKDALESVLKHPEKHAQRLVRVLDSKEESEFAGFVTSTTNMLDNTTGRKIRDTNAELSESVMSAARAKLKKSKNALLANKPVIAIKEILGNIRDEFPDTATLVEPYKSKIDDVKNVIDQRILALHDMVTDYDRQQVEGHNHAKGRFSQEERDEVARRVTISIASKKLKLESSQIDLTTHRALKHMHDATIDETFIGTIAEFAQKQAPEKSVIAAPTIINQRYREHSLYKDRFTPRTPSQVQQIQSMRNNALSIVVGDAGTGKTITTIAYAMDRLDRERKKIVIVRPMVELGAKSTIGFLPGGETEKIGPGFRPILKNLLKLAQKQEIKKHLGLDKPKGESSGSSLLDTLMPDQNIQLLPMAYMRGDTFDDITLIVEEAQNLTLMEAEAIITRAGEGAKIILAGDKIQTDLEMKDRRGEWLDPRHMPCLPLLIHAAKENASWMGVTIHPAEAIQRSALAKKAVGLFAGFRENAEALYPEVFPGYANTAERLRLSRAG